MIVTEKPLSVGERRLFILWFSLLSSTVADTPLPGPWCRAKKIDYFQKYGIILLVVSPTAKWTAKSVSSSNGAVAQMAMWKRIAIFTRRNMQTDFNLNKMFSVSPQTGKDNRDFSEIEINGKLLGVLNFNLMIPVK